MNYNCRYDQYYCFLNDNAEIKQAERWAQAQGTRVFIRNLLTSTVALDFNFVDNQAGTKTKCGAWEEEAKHHQSNAAVENLVALACETIHDISYLEECDCVCSVPSTKAKGFDLPSELAARIASETGKNDLTPSISLTNKTRSAKECPLQEKWDAWSAATLEFDASSFNGSDVILIDDKYQSGLTMHFVASKLLEQGANNVHGLVMVKTLRDTDNFNVVDT